MKYWQCLLIALAIVFVIAILTFLLVLIVEYAPPLLTLLFFASVITIFLSLMLYLS